MRGMKCGAIFLVATTLAFSAHLLLLSENTRMSHRLADRKREEERLKAQRNLLQLEAAALRHADRVKAIARGEFGMEAPQSSQLRELRPAAPKHSPEE